MLRWDTYVLVDNNKIEGFWKSHFGNKSKKNVLFITSKGFDVRMNFVINKFLLTYPNIELSTLVIEYHEGVSSTSMKYKKCIDDNVEELKSILSSFTRNEYSSLMVDLWRQEGNDKRRIGDRNISEKIYNYDISKFSDIIIDISSLPRGIYFSLIGTLLKKIDNDEILKKINLFVTVAENAEIDKLICEEGIEDRVKWIHGFGGELESAANQKPLVFFPILGEKKVNELNKIYTYLNPQELCPILPFPSKNSRRSDALIIDYHQVLFDELRVESQNIMYVAEQNPFEVYRTLSNAIDNYNSSLKILGGCNAAITAFSSKLLTIGVLLTAYEKGTGVGVYNLDAQGYVIENDDIEALKQLKAKSEIFLMWLNGEAYENQ